MAITTRHFGYKPVTQTYNFAGYTEHGNRLVVQDSPFAYEQGGAVPGQEFAGFEWTMGPDENRFHSIICYTAEVNDGLTQSFNTEGTIDTDSYVPGDAVAEYEYNGPARKLAFKGVPTQADFLGIANSLGLVGGPFASDAAAVAAINDTGLGAWTNYDGVNSDQDSGEREDEYFYSIKGCGGETEYVLKSDTELVVGNDYDASALLLEPEIEFIFDIFVVLKGIATQPHNVQVQGIPEPRTCEA